MYQFDGIYTTFNARVFWGIMYTILHSRYQLIQDQDSLFVNTFVNTLYE